MLQKVKDHLQITWDDDQRITAIIDNAQASLSEMIGVELNYGEPGPAQELLLDLCRYVYNNATEYFEDNFHRKILRLQLQVGAKELNQDGGS